MLICRAFFLYPTNISVHVFYTVFTLVLLNFFDMAQAVITNTQNKSGR
jgi:hypothetical protein